MRCQKKIGETWFFASEKASVVWIFGPLALAVDPLVTSSIVVQVGHVANALSDATVDERLLVHAALRGALLGRSLELALSRQSNHLLR